MQGSSATTKMSTNSENKSNLFHLPTEGPHNLQNCFNVILNRKKLVVKRDELENILQTNLNINTGKLNTRLISVLADSLVMYMKLWPGWQKSAFYFTGKLAYDDWFERFRQYLMYKMNFIITREQEYLDLMKGEDSGSMAVVCVQTDEIKKKEVASYSLMIHGQPSMLNNLIFLQRGGEF